MKRQIRKYIFIISLYIFNVKLLAIFWAFSLIRKTNELNQYFTLRRLYSKVRECTFMNIVHQVLYIIIVMVKIKVNQLFKHKHINFMLPRCREDILIIRTLLSVE